MFNFLLGRQRELDYQVYYTYRDSTYILTKVVRAADEFEANRIFDQTQPVEHKRVPNLTRPLP